MKYFVKFLFLMSTSLGFLDTSLEASNSSFRKRERSGSFDLEEIAGSTKISGSLFNYDLRAMQIERATLDTLIKEAIQALNANWRHPFSGDNTLHVILDNPRHLKIIRYLKSFHPILINAAIDLPNNAGITPRAKAYNGGQGAYDYHMNAQR